MTGFSSESESMISSLAALYRKKRYGFYARKALRPDFGTLPLKDLQAMLRQEGYFSQYGQDKWLAETLQPGGKPGVFCEIGAYDGVVFSNTCYLEKHLGWTGVAVEPVPETYARLVANRSCRTVQGCVGARSGRAHFLEVSGYPKMLSCMVDSCDSEQLQRIRSEAAIHGGTFREIEVTVYNINELLDAEGVCDVDYMSIDVEGAEYEIIRSLDFGKRSIGIISVESNYNDCRVPATLIRQGYVLHSIVGDAFYVKQG